MSKSHHHNHNHNNHTQTPTKTNVAATATAHTNAASTKCTYCQNGLGAVSIKCGECVNFYLCLKCFSMSAEIGPHKKDHNYYLKVNTFNFAFFFEFIFDVKK